MVQIEEYTTCSCCGKPVIRVPNDVTFSGTLHRCSWIRVDSGSYRVENNSNGDTPSSKEKKKISKYSPKPQKYIWLEQRHKKF